MPSNTIVEKEIINFRFFMPRRRISYPGEEELAAATLHKLYTNSKIRPLKNRQKIRTNDRHIGGEQMCPRLLLFIHVLYFIAAWFREDWIVSRLALTSICRKPSTVPTAGRPSLSRYTMIPYISAHDHANSRNVRTCQIIINTPHARALAI